MAEQASSGIHLINIRKTYGDTVALENLNLIAKPGEVLGVAGPNGAGKSTMVKILASETRQDSGSITLNGKDWDPFTNKHQVAVVHQEPQLFPNLTVAENILVGIEKSRRVRPKGDEVSAELLEQVGLAAVANVELGLLPLALQQRTEIAHALARDADVFLFDEPNSALTEEESTELFAWIHNLASENKIVILVSHRLSELAAHCDRVVVIVDGLAKTEIGKGELNEERLARELATVKTGREQAQSKFGKSEDLLTLSGWNHKRNAFKDIDLALAKGEILAVIGVEGSGGRELVRSLAGFEESFGDIALENERAEAAQRIVSFVSGDRAASLFTNFSVGENLFVRLLEKVRAPFRTPSTSKSREFAKVAVSQFLVKTASIDTPIRSLSGGNQQKVAIAAALAAKPKVVVLEEPTRGVDLNSKVEIYKLVREHVNEGNSAVFYCTEVSEVHDSSDRCVVISEGKVKSILEISKYADAEDLAEAITQSGR
jgi:ABC-type sugar transport system ATPase subunit